MNLKVSTIALQFIYCFIIYLLLHFLLTRQNDFSQERQMLEYCRLLSHPLFDAHMSR